MVVLFVATLGCSAADLFERPAPTPLPTRALAPTFTPTPENIQGVIIVTPPFQGTPGVIIVPPGTDPREVIPLPPTVTFTPVPTELAAVATASAAATEIPTATGTETPTPTITPTETPSPTPTTTATPFIMVERGLVALRSGPDVMFPLVAQLGPNIPISVIEQNPEGTWYMVCCVNGGPVWVAAAHVTVFNNVQTVRLNAATSTPPSPTPTFPPTPTGTATETPTATPYPFQRTRGPQFFPTENKFVTVFIKLHVGPLSPESDAKCPPDPSRVPNKEAPAEGYYVEVLFKDFPRPSTNGVQASANRFECNAFPGAGNAFEYNLKYEWKPPPNPTPIPGLPLTPTPSAEQLIGDGIWKVYVKDGAGNQLSDIVEFTTQPGNLNREVYISWERTR
jgi:hypothetical protein